MNNFYFKSLFIFISLVVATSTFSQEFGGNVEELLVKFENHCVQTKVDQIDQDQCDELLNEMALTLEENGVDKEQAAQVIAGLTPTCNPKVEQDASVDDIAGLTTSMEDATLKMSCTEEDQEEVASSCHQDLMCNLGRSVVTAVDKIAPDFIANRVRDSLGATASALGANKKCIDSDGSDCLTEVVTSFVANIVGTLNTLKDVASAALKSVWSLKDYIFKKSDDMHAAANSTTSEISKFIDSPGDYIVEKFMKAKNAIDGWIKKEVFCQKWEGTPHIGECTEPLESYSCLNCNDGLNAFCAGAGVFASEAFIAVSTAGTLTAANIAMKAGVRLGAAAATKAAARISAKVPALGRVAGESSHVARVASKSVKVSLATLQKVSESIAAYKKRIGEGAVTKHFVDVVEKVQAAASVVTIPLRYFDDVAERTMRKVVARASLKKGSDPMSHFIRAAARYERTKMVDLLRRGENLSNNHRGLFATKVIRRAWGHTGSSHLSSRNSSRWEGHSNPRSTPSNRSGGRQSERSHSREDRFEAGSGKSEERSGVKHEPTESESENKGSSAGLVATNLTPKKSSIVRATRYAIGLDLAAKVARGLSEAGGIEPTELLTPMAASEIVNGTGTIEKSSGLDRGQMDRSAIERRTGHRFDGPQEAQHFAEAMKSQYSDESKRTQIVDSIKAKGYSASAAEKIYESEKSFYNQNFLNDNQAAIARAFNGSASRRSSSEIDQTDNLVADIQKQIKDLEAELDGEGSKRPSDDNLNVQNRIVPSATPTATPSPGPSGRGSVSMPSSLGGGSGGGSYSPQASVRREGELNIPNEGISEEMKSEEKARRNPASQAAPVAEGEEGHLAEVDKDSQPSLAEAVGRPEMGKVDYLDLYLKLAEVAALSEDLGFAETSLEDEKLVDGQIDIRDYQVLNLKVKSKSYKIFRHKKSGSSVAFRVSDQGLDFLEDFPQDLI